MSRLWIMFVFAVIGAMLLALPPITAQDSIVFATNTPRADTPRVTAVLLTPEQPLERYALRLWLEQDMLSVILGQVQLLTPGDTEREQAIRLLQYELEWRFPGAPRDPFQREQLLDAMLAAPRGSVDMRNVVRPYIEVALNAYHPSFNGASSFDYNGFHVEITPANLDGVGALDAMIHTRYVTDSSEVLYEDYVLSQIDAGDVYRILKAMPSFPAAPLGDVETIRLERIGDVNRDGLDELAVSTQSSDVNQRMEIYGWRNGEIVSLVEPGQALAFGEIVNWPLDGTRLTVAQYQVESPAWGCLGEAPVDWTWNNNFFRPTVDPGGYTFVGSMACLLYGEEPLYELPTEEAINTIQSILSLSTSEEAAAAERAAMVVAMLNYLGGRGDAALETIQELSANAEPGSWLEQQTDAFLAAAGQPDATPVQICAALEAASEYGACDVDQVLTRLLREQPLRRNEAIEEQLSDLGITVLDMLTVSEVGHFNREAVHFNLAGDRWWQFAPLAADVYTAEKIAAPPGFEPRATPPPQVAPPPFVYEALMARGDVTGTLNVLNNAALANPGIPPSPAMRYLQALGYDLLADRITARQSYLSLWLDNTESIWGQLAAVHLERR